MDLNFIAIMAISIFLGIYLYSQFGSRSLSHRNIMSIAVVTSIIIVNYWAFSSFGVFDNLFPSSTAGPSLPEAITNEQAAIMEEYGTVENDTTCIDNYLYKGYDGGNAKRLCKVKERNE